MAAMPPNTAFMQQSSQRSSAICFGAVSHIQERLRQQRAVKPQQRYLWLLMEGVNFLAWCFLATTGFAHDLS